MLTRSHHATFVSLLISVLFVSLTSAHPLQQTTSLPPEVLDTTWDLVSLQPGGQPDEDVAGRGIPISFTAANAFRGSGGCTSSSGTYEAPGGQALMIKPPIASTLMACEDAVSLLEGQYFDALGTVKQYALNGTARLRLGLNGDGALVYESAAPATLPATGGPGASTSLVLALAVLLLAAGRWAHGAQGRRSVQ